MAYISEGSQILQFSVLTRIISVFLKIYVNRCISLLFPNRIRMDSYKAQSSAVVPCSSKENCKGFLYRDVKWCNSLLLQRVRVMAFNTTFNNISVIFWWSVLLVEETRVPFRKYHIMWYRVHLHERDSNSQLIAHDHESPYDNGIFNFSQEIKCCRSMILKGELKLFLQKNLLWLLKREKYNSAVLWFSGVEKSNNHIQ